MYATPRGADMTLDEYKFLTSTMSKIIALNSKKDDAEIYFKKLKSEEKVLQKQKDDVESKIESALITKENSGVNIEQEEAKYNTAKEEYDTVINEIHEHKLKTPPKQWADWGGDHDFLLTVKTYSILALCLTLAVILPLPLADYGFFPIEDCSRWDETHFSSEENCMYMNDFMSSFCLFPLIGVILILIKDARTKKNYGRHDEQLHLLQKKSWKHNDRKNRSKDKLKKDKSVNKKLVNLNKKLSELQSKIERKQVRIDSKKKEISDFEKEIKRLLNSVSHLTPYYDELNL